MGYRAAAPQRYPHVDLTRAQSRQMRNHAVDADAGEGQREKPEEPKYSHRESALPQRLRDDAIHCVNIVHYFIGIQLRNRPPCRRRQTRDKLRKITALFEGTSTAGERQAAAAAIKESARP